jgi:hypothetical protein
MTFSAFSSARFDQKVRAGSALHGGGAVDGFADERGIRASIRDMGFSACCVMEDTLAPINTDFYRTKQEVGTAL